MDRKEFSIYRIMKGHLSFRRDGLSLYIKEPDPNLLFDSIEIYDQFYDEAYGQGCYIQDEILEILYEKDLYSPFDDMDLDRYKKDLEELKYNAYKAVLRPRDLAGIKFAIEKAEIQISKIIRRKNQLDQYTCEGIASLAQWSWIIEKSTYFGDTHTNYDWKKIRLTDVTSYYESKSFSTTEFRSIARSEMWRPIWLLGKKTGNLFNKPSSMLTRDQIVLCSYSNMYDSVYENPESPIDLVIEDDDCLDGWFVDQKRKNERYKKEQEINSLTSNSKISNAGEVFVIAGSDQEAERIESYNSPHIQQVKKERMQQLLNKGEVISSDLEFRDVQIDLQMQNNQVVMDKARGK